MRKKGNYEQWIKFFLRGIIETCNDSIKTIENMDSLIKSDEKRIIRKTETVSKVFDYIKEHPIISIGETANALGLSFNGTSKAVSKLVEAKILKEITSKSRSRVFEYTRYMENLKSNM